MKRLIIFLLLFAAIEVAGQTTGYLRFDTVKIMKQNGTCELYIINKTKDSTGGILTNIGGGLTSFKKSRVNGDSLFVGGDTVVLPGGSSKLDSVTISTAADPDPDTLYQWRVGIKDLVGLIPKGGGSSGDTTYTELPIYVKTGTNDTLALDLDYLDSVISTVKVVHTLAELQAETGESDTLVALANWGLFRHRGTYPTNGQFVVAADNNTYWESVTQQYQPYLSAPVNIAYGLRGKIIGNSISQDPTPSYTTFVTYLKQALGSQIDNYSIAGSTFENIGDMWRNDRLPLHGSYWTIFNNGINSIRFEQNNYVRDMIINSIRSFLVGTFKNSVVDASSGTQVAGTWNTWTGLAATVVSKTNCMATTDSGAILSFSLNTNGSIPGVYVSFITNDRTTGADWTDSVDITDNLGNFLARVYPDRKSNSGYGPYVVFIPNIIEAASGIRIINRDADSLVVDFVGTTNLPQLANPALVAEITKVKDAALQPGIGHDWWDEMNDTIRRMVANEFTAYGFNVTTIPVNDEFYNNSTTYMYDDIHPSTFGHRNAIYKAARKRINIVNQAKDEVITATDANYLMSVTQGWAQASRRRIFILPQITANRTFQIPVGPRYNWYGQEIFLEVRNANPSFNWSLTNWNMIDNYGVSNQTLQNNTIYHIVFDTRGMQIVNKYGADSLSISGSDLTAIINGKSFTVNIPGGSAALTSTQIGYGNGSNVMTSEAALTYDATTNKITGDSANFSRIRSVDLIPSAANRTFSIRSPDGNIVGFSLINFTGTMLASHTTNSAGQYTITPFSDIIVPVPTGNSFSISSLLNVTNALTGQTASSWSTQLSNSGSYNTTSAALTGYGGRASATGTRSAGANPLTNVGFIGWAANAQLNHGLLGQSQTASTNTVQYGVVTDAFSSSTVAAGFGSGLLYKAKNGSALQVDIAATDAIQTTVTGGAENVDYVVRTKVAGTLTDQVRIFSNGTGRLRGGLEIGSIANGTAGTDSVLTVSNTSVRKIAGNHYASQAAFIDSLSDHWAYMTSISGGGSVTSVGLATGTSGTDIGVSGSPITTSGNITLNIPTASASNRGALSSSDWSTFNSKLSNITSLISAGTNVSLTGTGTSGDPYVISSGTGDLVIVNDADHTVTSTQSAIRYQNNITANRTVTLPNPSTVPGREIWVKWNTIDGAFSINITTTSGTALLYLDGTASSTSQSSNVDFLSILFKSDGTSWYKIN